MRAAAFIPIKLHNERTPGKNTRRLSDGTPLCHLIQQNLLQVSEIERVIVYCSDERIRDYLLPGVEFLKRPKELDSNSTRCGDIIRSFIDAVEADIYALSHATSPFIRPERFSACINAVASGEYDSAFTCKRVAEFLWSNGEPMNFQRGSIPRTQDMEKIFAELPSPYVFTRDVFEKYHGRTGIHPFMCECTALESIDIDWPEDFLIADAIYTQILKNKKI